MSQTRAQSGTSPAARTPAVRAEGGSAVTWRSVGLSLLLVPLNALWLVQMELIRYSAHPTTISLFFNAVFLLLAVTLVNALVGRWRPRWALRRGELYVVYLSVALASAVGGHDMIEILVPSLMWPFTAEASAIEV